MVGYKYNFYGKMSDITGGDIQTLADMEEWDLKRVARKLQNNYNRRIRRLNEKGLNYDNLEEVHYKGLKHNKSDLESPLMQWITSLTKNINQPEKTTVRGRRKQRRKKIKYKEDIEDRDIEDNEDEVHDDFDRLCQNATDILDYLGISPSYWESIVEEVAKETDYGVRNENLENELIKQVKYSLQDRPLLLSKFQKALNKGWRLSQGLEEFKKISGLEKQEVEYDFDEDDLPF